jgi:predicted amidohydrolase
MRAGAAQIDVALFDVAANKSKHLEYITRAREAGCQLLVFPELSLTGYLVGSRGYELGMGVADPVLLELAEAAGDMHTVVGFVEEGYAAQFFCAAAVLHRGEIQFIHRKLNLANYGAMEEAKFFSQGRYVETTPVRRPFTAGVLLCADVWNPALVHLAALHGATVLVVPTNSSLDEASGDFSKPAKWEVVLEFYSMIYGLPIVFANRIGCEGGHRFWGGSRIVDAQGEVVAVTGHDGEELIVADLDYGQIRRARFQLPTVRDSNLDLVQREVDRLMTRLGVPERIREDR